MQSREVPVHRERSLALVAVAEVLASQRRPEAAAVLADALASARAVDGPPEVRRQTFEAVAAGFTRLGDAETARRILAEVPAVSPSTAPHSPQPARVVAEAIGLAQAGKWEAARRRFADARAYVGRTAAVLENYATRLDQVAAMGRSAP